MKKSFVGLAITALTALAFSSAQSNLNFSGTVNAAPNSSLQNTVIIACLLVNDDCDSQRSGATQVNSSGSSAAFQVSNLGNEDYLLLAWRDLNNNSQADAGDELGVYQQNKQVRLLRPPASNLELRLARFTGDFDALIEQAADAPKQTNPNNHPNTQGNTLASSGLQFSFGSDWRQTDSMSFEASYGKDDRKPNGTLYLEVLPAQPKNGMLLVQTRALWQQLTKGHLDESDKNAGVYARRLPSGLNVGVTFGTLRQNKNSSHPDYPINGIYSVFFLVELGNQVTPLLFVMQRSDSAFAFYTNETEGRPLMLEVMNKLKPIGNITPTTLFSESDLLGKWKATSGGSLNTNWYSASTGAYVTSSFSASSFGQWVTLQKGGTGTYSQSLATSNNSGTTFQGQKGKLVWRISGDFLTLEMIDQGFKQYYQLYGSSRDDKGNPVMLMRFLYNGNAQTRDDVDGTPDQLWLVDN